MMISFQPSLVEVSLAAGPWPGWRGWGWALFPWARPWWQPPSTRRAGASSGTWAGARVRAEHPAPRAHSLVTTGASPPPPPSPRQWRRGRPQWPTRAPVTAPRQPRGSWAGGPVLGPGQRQARGRGSHSRPRPPSTGKLLQLPQLLALGQTSLETDKVSKQRIWKEFVYNVSCFRSRMEIHGVRELKEKESLQVDQGALLWKCQLFIFCDMLRVSRRMSAVSETEVTMSLLLDVFRLS